MLSIFFLLCWVAVDHSLAVFDPTKHPNWHLLDNRNCHSNATSRIIGGSSATLGEFPWLARLITISDRPGATENSGCSGSILTNRVILTAAHCVTGLKDNTSSNTLWQIKVIRVIVGEYNMLTNPDCDERICSEKPQTIFVKGMPGIIYHKLYSHREPLRNDIALIRLASDIQFNSYIFPICTPRGYLMTENFKNYDAVAVGWGVVDWKTREKPMIMQKVTLRIRDSFPCDASRVEYHEAWEICAGGEDADKGTCFGDSGGPLMIVDKHYGRGNPRHYIIGVTSYGQTHAGKCGAGAKIFGRVTAYMPWILDNLVEDKSDFLYPNDYIPG